MKAKQQTETKNLLNGNTINPELQDKYRNEPFFLAKATKMKEILKKSPLPEYLVHQKEK